MPSLSAHGFYAAMSWIKEVPVSEIDPLKHYFIAMHAGVGSTWFWCQYLSGKEAWASKPGIAIRFHGGPAFVAEIEKKGGKIFAVEVPSDADNRWRARKHPRLRNRAR